uniref:Uncharacterized protein n=1 Tax=Amazona collaria TaxID=241587 RepID=A0A8B9GCD1_9PSIT
LQPQRWVSTVLPPSRAPSPSFFPSPTPGVKRWGTVKAAAVGLGDVNHCCEVMPREVADLGEKPGGLGTASTHLQATTRPTSPPACCLGINYGIGIKIQEPRNVLNA